MYFWEAKTTIAPVIATITKIADIIMGSLLVLTIPGFDLDFRAILHIDVFLVCCQPRGFVFSLQHAKITTLIFLHYP